MQNGYWEKFMLSGSVRDYLDYKSMEGTKAAEEQDACGTSGGRTGEGTGESDNSYRDGAVSGASWRI